MRPHRVLEHSGTFNGNPVTVTAGSTTQNALTEMKPYNVDTAPELISG